MRATLRSVASFLLLGAAAILLAPATGLAQNPAGAGGGFRNRDPNERFNEYTGGKDVWKRSDITDPNMQRRFDFYAQMMGVTTGEITREQYVNWSNQRLRAAGAAPGTAPVPGPALPPRISWEYKAMNWEQVAGLAPKQGPDALTVGLNKLGAEGWELVTVTSLPGEASLFLFKRPAEGGRREEAASPANKREARADEFRIFRLKNADAIELAQTLMPLFRGADGKAPRLVGEGRTNSLLAAGSPEQLESVEALINELDTPAAGKAQPRQK